jgi:hypothetical protein
MFDQFRGVNPATGIVYFANAAPSVESYADLLATGAEIVPLDDPEEDAVWAFALRHPAFDAAKVWQPKALPDVGDFLQFGDDLTPAERAAAGAPGGAVRILVPTAYKGVLRERKRLLRFLHLLMPEDAVLAVDLGSGRPWSKAGLDAELEHGAPLDPASLYVYHTVKGEDGRVNWIHTHGLAEFGGFDLDILRPNEFVESGADEVLRALAFAMLEGKIEEKTESFHLAGPDGDVSLVPAREFMETASAEDRALRETDGRPGKPHQARRAVVCDPLRGELSGTNRPRPSRFLAERADAGMRFSWTDAADELMALRAQKTRSVLGSVLEEFASVPLTAKVRLSFPRATSATPEQLWFEVHSMHCDSVDCTVDSTLLDEPSDVVDMHRGLRAVQSLSRVSDWLVSTPAGTVTPRSTLPIRLLRETRK